MNNLLRKAVVASSMLLSFLTSIQSFAQEEEWDCINSNSKSNYLVKQYQEAMKTSPISDLIYKSFPVSPAAKTEADALLDKPCTGCLAAQLKFPTADIESFKKFVQSGVRINTACIRAARHFSATAPEVKCPENVEVSSPAVYSGKGKTKKLEEAGGACVTLPMLDYQGLVLENMYRCIRKYSSAPFSPATLFEIMSRESTFRPNYSDKWSGHGSGQLTQPFVKDTQQSWRGRPTLEAIAKDSTPECAAAAKLTQGDLSKNYQLSRDRCEFMQYGSGLERNALWMMVGLDTLWRKNLNPNFASYLKKHKDHPQLSKVMEKMLQMAYGRTGQGGMYAVYDKLKSLPPDRFLRELGKPMNITTSSGETSDLTAYVRELSSRQKDLAKYVDHPEMKAQFAAEGASACIQ